MFCRSSCQCCIFLLSLFVVCISDGIMHMTTIQIKVAHLSSWCALVILHGQIGPVSESKHIGCLPICPSYHMDYSLSRRNNNDSHCKVIKLSFHNIMFQCPQFLILHLPWPVCIKRMDAVFIDLHVLCLFRRPRRWAVSRAKRTRVLWWSVSRTAPCRQTPTPRPLRHTSATTGLSPPSRSRTRLTLVPGLHTSTTH